MENETYEVVYYTLDLNEKYYIERTKKFYFKKEAFEFSNEMERKTGKISRVYKIIEKKERIY